MNRNPVSQHTWLEDQWRSLLSSWTSTGAFDNALLAAYGSTVSEDRVRHLLSALLNPTQDDFPRAVELSPDHLGSRLAAFSPDTNRVYVDQDLSSFPGLATSVLAHELGHWVDFQLHGSPTGHDAVRLFADALLGRPHAQGGTDGPGHGQPETLDQLALPGGRVVRAQFFDTSVHIDWIREQLLFLSNEAVQAIESGQHDTDSFYASDDGSFVLLYSPYGLQTHAPSHFDNNNISGGLAAIRSRWIDGLSQFNSTEVQALESEQFLGINHIDALSNPRFVGPYAGVQLLLYRFGQINHALEDFYSHSNWIESVKRGLIPASRLIDAGLDLPVVLQPGEILPGTNVVIAQSGVDWSSRLKKTGTGSYSGSKYDVYWDVDSNKPSAGGGVLSATTLDGKTIYGLATGATNGAIYKDRDYSVFLRDPTKTGLLQKEYFRGFDHGGIAGTVYGQWVGPLNKDKTTNPDFLNAKKLANLQLQNEWDRMGNLIYKNYGESGLQKFADYVLPSQELRQAYVSTFSTSGARFFAPAASLSLAARSVPAAMDAAAMDAPPAGLAPSMDAIPEIRLVRLFGPDFSAASSPFAAYQDRYQFLDPNSRAWFDTDFHDISIHHELEAEDVAKLTTPSQIQHAAKGERAMWSLSRDDSIDEMATSYFVELVNRDVKVYIPDVDIHHDRIILVKADGGLIRMPDGLYDVTSVDRLVAELAAYGVVVNFSPEVEFRPGTILVSEAQLAAPLTITAASVAGDAEGQSLFFVGYDDSIPFLRMVDGVLTAAAIDSQYAGRTYTAYVDVSDGVSIVRGVPLRLAIAPKLRINGQAFDSETGFALRINDLAQQGFEIVAQIADHLPGSLDSFLPITAAIGSISGTPTGYDGLASIVNISDDYHSGDVSFWRRDPSGELTALTVGALPDGGFRLSSGALEVARLTPLSLTTSLPEIVEVSYSDILADGLGVRLNPTLADLVSRENSSPWQVALSVELFREASYASQVGLMLVDRISGDIIDPVTGLSPGSPSSAWYQDAEKCAVWTGGVEAMKTLSAEISFNLDARVDPDSVVLMPFMKTTIGGQAFFYSSFDGLNSDGMSHVVELSRNVFGFEDLPGLGDKDMDDLILRVNSISVL